MQGYPATEQHFFAGELKIAHSRLLALRNVFGSPAEMVSYINTFSLSRPGGPSPGKSAAAACGADDASPKPGAAASSAGDPTTALGQAPPTRSYKELLTFEA